MKLFLSSVRLPNKDERVKLFGDLNERSVVIIPNAWDTSPKARQEQELSNTSQLFKKIGFSVSVLDIAKSQSQQTDTLLSESDFVWFMGGNTFYLNYLVQQPDFLALLRKSLSNGLIYGGASAGAVIAGPTLHGTENVDNPADAPKLVWQGLGLVNFGITPHWATKSYFQLLKKMKVDMSSYVNEVVTLTDDQAATVIDGKLTIS